MSQLEPSQEAYFEKIQEIHRQIKNGKFADMASSIQLYITKINISNEEFNSNQIDSQMNTLLNTCLVFGFLKLKEYKNAR